MKQILNDAVASHLSWTEAFQRAIETRTMSDDVKFSGYDDMCSFGKWLYSLDDVIKRKPAFRLVKDLHYRFHAEAGEIVSQMKAGHFTEAQAYLGGDYAATSARLVQALRDWQAAENL